MHLHKIYTVLLVMSIPVTRAYHLVVERVVNSLYYIGCRTHNLQCKSLFAPHVRMLIILS